MMAPLANLIEVNEAASINSLPSAIRHRMEFAAKAIMANKVRRAVLIIYSQTVINPEAGIQSCYYYVNIN